jgi:hypothetical protein
LEPTLNIKVNPKVGVGISSLIGFAMAGVQYLGVAYGLVEDGALSFEELGVLATATATLYGTIRMRGQQATAAIVAAGQPTVPVPGDEPGAKTMGWNH